MRNCTPVHIAFSAQGDHIAVLHGSGHVQIWNLQTRIDFSRSKAMDPVKTIEFDLSNLLEAWDGSDLRQICLWDKQSEPNSFVVACLASGSESDELAILDVVDKEVLASRPIPLPNPGGRLVNTIEDIYWQSPEGKIFVGEIFI